MSKRANFFSANSELLENITDAVIFVSLDGTIVHSNKPARKLLELQDQSTNINQYLDFHLLRQKQENRLIMRSKVYPKTLFEVISVKVNNKGFYLILNEINLKDHIPEVKHYIDQLVATSNEGLMLFDKNGAIIDCEQSLARTFQYTSDELKTLSLSDLAHESDRDKLLRFVENQNEPTIYFRGIRKDGDQIHLKMTQQSLNNKLCGAMIARIKNVNHKIDAEQRIIYMANYYILMSLPNCNYFFNKLEIAIEEAKTSDETFAVLHIHLNYLKQINGTFGYDVGDELLKLFSEKLKGYLKLDTFIARLDSNEFIILLRNAKNEQYVKGFVEKLIKEMTTSFHIKDYDVQTTLSIGISLYPEHGMTANELLKNADAALYMVRETGEKEYNFYESSLSRKFKLNLKMESELHKALMNKQFALHYQPQKCLKSGEVIGIEALLRWKHPIKGIIPPLEFIPLAEKTNLIVDIGRWVLYEACRQNKRWQNQGYRPVVVSVNLSAKQLFQKHLVHDVQTILQKTKLDPH